MARPVSELFNTLNGRPAAVIGGGVSSPDDILKVPVECYMIAVNHHCSGLLEPDLAVALDERTIEIMSYQCPKVGAYPTYDYTIWDGGKNLMNRFFNKSAFMAVDLAFKMGASEVYLCGIDCYMGDGTYWYDKDGAVGKRHQSDRGKRYEVSRWEKFFKGLPVKAVSGPLVEVLGGVH